VTAPGIHVKGLCFRIGSFTMKDLELEVPDGEYFVLTGPNGAGKTILIRLLSGLLRPESGEISVQGRSLTDLPPWKRNMGYVPQEALLFPNYTVERNIDFGLRMRHRPVEERRKEVGRVAEFLGIGDLLDRRTKGLSGGERQKVALARVLVLNPAVLLLDEPVSAIDEKTRDPLCRELKRVQRELSITTLHVSHNRNETALVADRVGILEGGTLRIEDSGDPEMRPLVDLPK
jgi:ABC-type sugar transport system ATPase subunit